MIIFYFIFYNIQQLFAYEKLCNKTEKKDTNYIFFKISQKYKKNFVIIFSGRVLSIPKLLLHTVRNKIKKNHDNWIKNKTFI